jgi:hypothetical protein
MELLRIPSRNTDAVIPVGDALTEYNYSITDESDSSTTNGTVTSDSDSEVTLSLPSRYDGSYIINVDGQDTFFSVTRPYVDPTTRGQTKSEIEDYSKHEELARAIIDSVVREGFYYKKYILQTTGLGSDYLPLWVRAQKVLRLYENNVLMYDVDEADSYSIEYSITKDKTSIVEVSNQRVNRLEGAPLILPAGGSDILDTKYVYRGFPRTFDYTVVLEVGHQRLPSDIVRAAELLTEDIACGRMEYPQRYIQSYQTDQFKIGYSNMVFEGTGNLIVDKILLNYTRSITRLGVL